MGSSSNEFNSLIVWNMKYLALLAIALFAVVAAEPEADADAAAHYYGGYYGYPGYGYGYGGYYRHFGKRSADAEPEADADADAYYYGAYGRGYYGGYYGRGYYGYPGYAYGAYRHFGKRSADAEADPALLLANYPSVYAYPYAYAPIAPVVAAPVAGSYQHVSTPAATYGISQVHKRSADAEPEADADADAYYYGAYGRGYYGGYYGRGYYGYPGYAYGAYRHFGKRSADAEADAGVAVHPAGATSFVARSPQGAKGLYVHPYYAPYAPYYGYYHG